MDFVYQPEGAPEKRWPWQPGRMKLAEAELAEEMAKMTHGEWTAEVIAGSMRATHVLLFILLRRDVPELTMEAVDFLPDEVGFDLDETEVRELLDLLEKVKEPTDTQLAQIAAFRGRLGLPPVEPSPEQDPEPADAPVEEPAAAFVLTDEDKRRIKIAASGSEIGVSDLSGPSPRG